MVQREEHKIGRKNYDYGEGDKSKEREEGDTVGESN